MYATVKAKLLQILVKLVAAKKGKKAYQTEG